MSSPRRTELHPAFAEQFDQSAAQGLPRSHQVSPDGARRLIEDGLERSGALEDPEPVGDVREYPIPGPDGGIPVRIYTPEGEGPFPTLVWLHGGGWVRGSIDATDPFCRHVTNEVGCAVVSVGYRLAPEDPFPAGLEDCYAALEWTAANPDVTKGDPDRIAVGGASAGGNLTAALTLLSRDRGGPAIAHQVPVVPVTDHSFDRPSYEENATGYGLKAADMEYYWDHYLEDAVDGQHPYASPLQARDLSGLPPATPVTCGFDVLRDEGIAYVERLEAAGVPVEHLHYPDAPHALLGSTYLTLELEPTMAAMADVTGALGEGLSA